MKMVLRSASSFFWIMLFSTFGFISAEASTFPAVFKLSSLDGTNGFRIDGVTSRSGSGFAVAGIGDINGDGFADVIIGAPFAPTRWGPEAGRSYVLFGRGSGFPAAIKFQNLDSTV